MEGALQGVRVVDLTGYLAGPYCSMLMGDLGAEVIKIEEPQRGDGSRQWGPPFINGESAYYLSVNRNKKSLALNLKHEKGKEILKRLVSNSDVLIENYRPGTTEKLGIGYRMLSKDNPRLIYCSISGFGQEGPYREKSSYDIVAQAMGGVMSLTGESEGQPIKVGIAISDICAGMFATIGILAALNARTNTGKGQMVDVSLLDGQISWLTYQAGSFFATGKNPPRLGTAHPTIVPYQAFEAGDSYFVMAVGNDSLWARFCKVVGLEKLGSDPKFITNKDRVKNRKKLIGTLETHFRAKPAREWLRLLEAAGIPCGPIYNLNEVFKDPQVLHREMVREVKHPKAGKIRVVGTPFKMSHTPPAIRLHPPLLGENTREVLLDLGYTEREIRNLKEALT